MNYTAVAGLYPNDVLRYDRTMKITIGIIEDDIAIQQMYRMKFESEGYNVEVADNGEEGLAMIEGTKPTVILLDLMMPVMDGPTMLAKLREMDWGKEVPVFILTNMGKEEAPDDLETLGIEAFIVKAEMTPKQVAEKIKKILPETE